MDFKQPLTWLLPKGDVYVFLLGDSNTSLLFNDLMSQYDFISDTVGLNGR